MAFHINMGVCNTEKSKSIAAMKITTYYLAYTDIPMNLYTCIIFMGFYSWAFCGSQGQNENHKKYFYLGLNYELAET